MSLKSNEKVKEKRLTKRSLWWPQFERFYISREKNFALLMCYITFKPFEDVAGSAYCYRYRPKLYNWLTAFLERAQAV